MRVWAERSGRTEPVITGLRSRGKAVFGAALLFAAAAILSPVSFVQVTFLLVAVTMGLAALVLRFETVLRRLVLGVLLYVPKRIFDRDSAPIVISLADGEILYANAAARRDYRGEPGQPLARLFDGLLANPDHAIGLMARQVDQDGTVSRQIDRVTGSVCLNAGRLCPGVMFWRLEAGAIPNDKATSDYPVIGLDDNDVVRGVNPAARDLLGPNADMLALFCPNLPLRPGEINVIRTSRDMQCCFVHEIAGKDGQRDILLLPAGHAMGGKAEGWDFFESLPVALLKLSREGVIDLSNRHARALLGVESGEGRRLSELMEGPGRSILDWLSDAADGRGTVRPEILKTRREDSDVFLQVALNPMRDGGKTVLVAVLQDATKLKALEEQFVQSQKMQAIGQLAGGVAHDFNNLLTAISGHCDLLLLRHGQADMDYPDLMQIHQNANRAAALVGQLLAFSRKQTLRPKIMNIREMMSDLMHLLNRLVGARVQLEVSNDPGLWAVRADKRQLEQVLMNLVVNARDAMPEGGRIQICTKNQHLENPLRRNRALVAPGRYVVITVSDEGTGIPEERLDKVFEPFFTTKKQGEGTGLGLSTAYGIIKQTGGFIFADSTLGEGTCFTLYLPAHDHVEDVPAEDHAEEEHAAGASGVVLLVEDEAPVRAFASRALTMAGLSVIEAGSGEEALSCLKDADIEVDVFVTDVVMPGMDGPTWVAEALKTRPEARVVFISGYAADSVTGLEIGGDGAVFLPKPFSLTELTETVQKQITQ